jgi:hypothetical protein
LRIVSIMPGIERAAPERTETSKGLVGEPSDLPVAFSRRAMAVRIWRSRPAGHVLPLWSYSAQAAVVMVKPGGTGRPMRVISARPAPLPPSSSRIEPSPSALPWPK